MSRASDLAESLEGTCNSTPAEMEDFTADELAEFDSLIFECTECGWWFETGEANEGPNGDVCTACAPEEDD